MKPICSVCGIRKITKKVRQDMPEDMCWICGSVIHRRLLKRRAIEYKGGECSKCGYSKCDEALQFHHIDPSLKQFSFREGYTRMWTKVVIELDKCMLLCANCHAEVHYQIRLNSHP